MPYLVIKKLLRMDWILFLLVGAMAAASVALIYSATYTSDDESFLQASKNQLYWIPIALVIYFVLALVDYRRWLQLAWPFALIMLTLLVLVLFFGQEAQGARSWFRFGGIGIQPAEFAKLAFILMLAKFLAGFRPNRKGGIVRQIFGFGFGGFWTVLAGAIMTALPMVLIFQQPDFGSGSVFFPIALLMMFTAGVGLLYIALPVAAIYVGVLVAYHGIYLGDWHGSDYMKYRFNEAKQVRVSEPIFRTKEEAIAAGVIPDERPEDVIRAEEEARKKERAAARLRGEQPGLAQKDPVFILPVLKEYQIDRIKTFYNPNLDPKDAGWTINQSLIAIGSGGWDGAGYQQGTQNILGYLPKNVAYNDLIFSVIGEEWGFVGGSTLILAQGLVLVLCLRVGFFARDRGGMLIATGVTAMLFAHIFVNIGMTIQVVPITGIPLPFISYGGSFLVVCLAGIGLVQSVWIHRKPFDVTPDPEAASEEPARLLELEHKRKALAAQKPPRRIGVPA
ncbi:MAG: rod shape-determining protein RodA [Verrucomicrobiota bacterium]